MESVTETKNNHNQQDLTFYQGQALFMYILQYGYQTTCMRYTL